VLVSALVPAQLSLATKLFYAAGGLFQLRQHTRQGAPVGQQAPGMPCW